MSAQPAEAGQPARPEPTIRMVRAALPEAHRDAFQAEIERTPLHLIGRTLAAWDLRARALANPTMIAMARRIGDEHAGRAPQPSMLPDDELRALAPALRP
jgi:hypothetical protein